MTQEKAKMEKLDGKSMDVVEHNIEQLKELFPEVFAEGKISFDKLQELLGNYLVEDEDHYNFTWHGKRAAGRLAQTPSTGTLRPAKDESVDWDTTQNLFIEGDNLEVLKLLQKSYHRQVKMIYIDPPYNTGNEFIYPDKFQDNLDTYLRYTGQVDDEGYKFSANTDTTGRYHTNWLNMMYPRLKLARNLLREDGVIFISIDDHEQSNLKKLCDEVFGSVNQLTPFVWELPRGINAGHVSKSHEYVIVYAKSKVGLPQFLRTDQSEYSIDRCNKKIDFRHPVSEIQFPAGLRFEGENAVFTDKIDGSEEIYIEGEMVFEDGKLKKPVTLKAGWTMKNMIQRWLDDEEVYDTKGQKIVEFFFKKNGKLYSKKLAEYQSAKSVIKNVGDYQDARVELEKYFGSQDIFEYPKPLRLIEYLAALTCRENDLVLDFFAGSCPTADAIMNLNVENENNRKYILVQLPEMVSKENSEAHRQGFRKISDLGIERIRRAAKKIKEENPDYEGDLGFKVFKLDSSNIKRWEADFETLEEDLLGAVDYIKNERSSDDVLYELLLKYGLDLTVPIETRTIAGKNIYSIGLGALVVCLEKDVSMDVVSGIGKLKEELNPEIMRVVFKDEGFKDDVVKTNALQTLKRYGIEDIKSL